MWRHGRPRYGSGFDYARTWPSTNAMTRQRASLSPATALTSRLCSARLEKSGLVILCAVTVKNDNCL
jgi:hypothetical protein